MDELLAEFIAETRETHEAIAGEIVAWEKDPSDKARLDSIFRFIHTVKGSSGFLDLPRLQMLSHEAESALSDVRAGQRETGPALVSAILAVIDRISHIVSQLENGDTGEEDDDADLFALLEQQEETIDRPEKAAEPAAIPVAPSQPVRTIRVPVELLDRLMNGVSDLVLSRNELGRQLRRVSNDNAVAAAFDKISNCVTEMRDAISWTRMQRIERLFAPLPRLVRDLSSELGKSASLQLIGSDVELDRELIEMLRDPLVHIVRNALDHGVEPVEERIAAGKNAEALLRVSARQSGNRILVEISDDGRGLASDMLVQRAIAQGVVDAESAASMDEDERLALIFEPGLSTAAEVSAVSGRGVGMDVVRANVERVGGTVEVKSRPGWGTTIVLQVPLTLTIIPSLIVGIADRSYAIPRQAIDRIISLAKGQARIERVGGAEVAQVNGRRMPTVNLGEMLSAEPVDGASGFLVTLKLGKGERFGLIVSSVFAHEDLVAKPVAPAIAAAGIYAGAALPDSGRPLLMLDAVAVAERAGLRLSDALQGQVQDEQKPAGNVSADTVPLLVFDDCDQVRRALPMSVVEHINAVPRDAISERDGKPYVTTADSIWLLSAAGPLPEGDAVRLVRLEQNGLSLYYAIGGEADIIDFAGEIRPAPRADRASGFAVIQGQTVEVVDIAAVFAEFAGEMPPTESRERPKCRIAGGDERWRFDFLAPIVESAGYEAVFDTETEPDVVLTLGVDADQDGDEKVIKLAADETTGQDTLYRYDRDGIYAALQARIGGKGAAR